MLILVDVDGTVANLNTEWLRRYNLDYQDNLTPDDLKEWEMTKFVKPTCGAKIYDYLDSPDLYDRVLPVPGSQMGVRLFRNWGHRVVFASAGVGAASNKLHWLQEWGFYPGKHAQDFVSIYDKSLLRADFLIDDRDQNIVDFGDLRSILIDAPHNRTLQWQRRAESWEDVVQMVKETTDGI
jgi:5'(3')-deoxyribonucleotidase